MTSHDDAGSQGLPQADSLLTMLNLDEMAGAACALLTPALKARLRDLAPGQVLEVRVNDPTARLDVEAWSQLTGNQLLAMTAVPPNELRFFIQKKSNT